MQQPAPSRPPVARPDAMPHARVDAPAGGRPGGRPDDLPGALPRLSRLRRHAAPAWCGLRAGLVPLGLALGLLAACAAPPAPPADTSTPRVPDTGDACGASGYAGLVGRPLAAVTLPADLGARIVAPDTVVTMDIRPDRLNIATDAGGIVTRVYCG